MARLTGIGRPMQQTQCHLTLEFRWNDEMSCFTRFHCETTFETDIVFIFPLPRTRQSSLTPISIGGSSHRAYQLYNKPRRSVET